MLEAARTGLPKDSVANVSQILSIDRALLEDRVGSLIVSDLELVLNGIMCSDTLLTRLTTECRPQMRRENGEGSIAR